MFSEGIGKVVLSGSKIHENVSLSHTVLNPIPAHVHGFGPFLLHGAIGKTVGGGVIDLDWGGPLGMPQFFECRGNWHRILAV